MKKFQKLVKKELEKAGCKVELTSVTKNNGIIREGLIIRKENEAVSPTVYLDGFFDDYKNGEDLSTVVKKIERVINSADTVPEEFKDVAKMFFDFDFVKKRIIKVLVNTKNNEEMLKAVPHKEKEDLSFIYKVLLPGTEDGRATITIKNEHLKYWGVTQKELEKIANKNTVKLLPIRIRSMEEVMREMMGSFFDDDDFPELPIKQQLFVVSNEAGVMGATTMFYKSAFKDLAEKMETDLYILPSSVHEVIAVSTEMGEPKGLSGMVTEINGSQVGIEDQLSDNVYRYNRKTGKIKLA